MYKYKGFAFIYFGAYFPDFFLMCLSIIENMLNHIFCQNVFFHCYNKLCFYIKF